MKKVYDKINDYCPWVSDQEAAWRTRENDERLVTLWTHFNSQLDRDDVQKQAMSELGKKLDIEVPGKVIAYVESAMNTSTYYGHNVGTIVFSNNIKDILHMINGPYNHSEITCDDDLRFQTSHNGMKMRVGTVRYCEKTGRDLDDFMLDVERKNIGEKDFYKQTKSLQPFIFEKF